METEVLVVGLRASGENRSFPALVSQLLADNPGALIQSFDLTAQLDFRDLAIWRVVMPDNYLDVTALGVYPGLPDPAVPDSVLVGYKVESSQGATLNTLGAPMSAEKRDHVEAWVRERDPQLADSIRDLAINGTVIEWVTTRLAPLFSDPA